MNLRLRNQLWTCTWCRKWYMRNILVTLNLTFDLNFKITGRIYGLEFNYGHIGNDVCWIFSWPWIWPWALISRSQDKMINISQLEFTAKASDMEIKEMIPTVLMSSSLNWLILLMPVSYRTTGPMFYNYEFCFLGLLMSA